MEGRQRDDIIDSTKVIEHVLWSKYYSRCSASTTINKTVTRPSLFSNTPEKLKMDISRMHHKILCNLFECFEE